MPMVEFQFIQSENNVGQLPCCTLKVPVGIMFCAGSSHLPILPCPLGSLGCGASSLGRFCPLGNYVRGRSHLLLGGQLLSECTVTVQGALAFSACQYSYN